MHWNVLPDVLPASATNWTAGLTAVLNFGGSVDILDLHWLVHTMY